MTLSKSRGKTLANLAIFGTGGALLLIGLLALLGRAPGFSTPSWSGIANPGTDTLVLPAAAPSRTPGKSAILNILRSEAARVGQVDSNPQSTEIRLKKFANTLREPDLQALAVAAVDPDETGDARFLASYLLTLSGGTDALLSVARSPMPNLSVDSAQRSVEIAVRAQAIEGLTGQPAALRALIASLSDPFLTDRAQRALYVSERSSAGTVSSQDEAALRKVF